jgi:hypothetical protein
MLSLTDDGRKAGFRNVELFEKKLDNEKIQRKKIMWVENSPPALFVS